MSIIRSRLLTIIVLGLSLYFIFSLSQNTYNLWQRAEKVEDVRQDRLKEEKRNQELNKKLEFSQSTDFIEKQAREKLGLTKPGETVVIMTPQEATSSSAIEILPNWKKWWNLFF
ncbi:MAG: septum formation initiator family protein [bacterium]|nr:septum formation initiator family protein [bacterium]